MLRNAQLEDAKQIAAIYNYYISNSIATFEEIEIDKIEMQKRMEESMDNYPWIVYEVNNKIIAYAYASTWNKRSAYNRTAECTVYLDHNALKKGIGSILYKELIRQLKALGFHALIGGISLPNEASLRLHEKFGFKKVAHFEAVGFKFGKWIDVAYWELLIL